jgi:phosphopantothenoylcysteine decarboxylase/phosphopantothenate--cysteine ligase
VADYTLESAPQKIAKSDGPLVLTLSRTRDILADLGATSGRKEGRPILVGFAAETHDVIEHARAKLQRKKIDLIVANDVSRTDAGFEVDANAVTIVSATEAINVPLQSKAQIAARILDAVEPWVAKLPAVVRL